MAIWMDGHCWVGVAGGIKVKKQEQVVVPISVPTVPAQPNHPVFGISTCVELCRPQIRLTRMIIIKLAFTKSCVAVIWQLVDAYYLKAISSCIFKLQLLIHFNC